MALAQHDIGFDDHAAFRVRRANDTAFGDGGMREQARLHLWPSDVVASGNDHVVRARLIPEIAVGIADIGVAGDVPAIEDVFELARIGEVAAAGWSAHREAAGRAIRHIVAFVVDDPRLVSRHGNTGRAGADRLARGGDENMQHLGGPDAIHQRKAGLCLPRLEGRLGQCLTSGNADPEAREIVLANLVEHRAIGRRRGEADARAVFRNRRKKVWWASLLEQDAGSADPERKQHQPAQPEGEGERRRADEAIFRLRFQHPRGITIADREEVAVEVQRALWLARRAGSEADEANIILRRIGRRELLIAGLCHQRFKFAISEQDNPLEIRRQRGGGLQFIEQAMIAEREGDLRLGDGVGEFAGTQQRHGRHRDATRLDDRKVAGDQHRVIGRTQQHAIARHEAEIARQHVGHAVHARGEIGVGPGLDPARFAADQRDASAVPRRDMAVDELGGDIEPLGIVKPGFRDPEIRHVFCGRQIVPAEGIDMPRSEHAHAPLVRSMPWDFSASRAMTIFCTSVAPS